MCGCNDVEFIASLRGTTLRYISEFFSYSKCIKCNSLICTNMQQPNYSDYKTGGSISERKTKRMISLFNQINVTKKHSILDFGCGNGALVQKLNKNGYNVNGFEPFGEKYSHFPSKKFDCIYMTHVFEHITDFKQFFLSLKKLSHKNTKIITIHPSSSRMKKIFPSNSKQIWAIHAPYHTIVPSDKATRNIFRKNGFDQIQHYSYDWQRSGIRDNNNVSALLFRDCGGTKDQFLSTTKDEKVKHFLKSPCKYINALFFDTKDFYASTFVFKVIE